MPAGVTREQQAARDAAELIVFADDRIESPEGIAPPPGDYTSWDEYMRDVETDAALEHLERTRHLRDEEYRQGMKAMRLAPTLAIYRALVNGERVPREALDPKWVRRYRL